MHYWYSETDRQIWSGSSPTGYIVVNGKVTREDVKLGFPGIACAVIAVCIYRIIVGEEEDPTRRGALGRRKLSLTGPD